jgi:hypothetical protein
MNALYCILALAVASILAEGLGSTPDWYHAGEIFFHQAVAILIYSLFWKD